MADVPPAILAKGPPRSVRRRPHVLTRNYTPGPTARRSLTGTHHDAEEEAAEAADAHEQAPPPAEG